MLHSLKAALCPMHCFPPYCGFGFVQSLVLVCMPLLFLLHRLHLLQSLQPPWTYSTKKKINIWINSSMTCIHYDLKLNNSEENYPKVSSEDVCWSILNVKFINETLQVCQCEEWIISYEEAISEFSCACFKTSLSAKPFLWKWVLYAYSFSCKSKSFW